MRLFVQIILAVGLCLSLCARISFSENATAVVVPTEKKGDFEFFVDGKKYSSITDYKRAHLEKEVREAVTKTSENDLNVFQDGVRRALVAGDLHLLSLAVLQSVWGELTKKLGGKSSSEKSLDVNTESSEENELYEMRALLEEYEKKRPQEPPVSVRPQAMKMITIQPAVR